MPSGGSRNGAGAPKKLKPQEISGPLAEKRNLCQRALEVMEQPNWNHCIYGQENSCPLCLVVWDFRSVKADGPGNRHWTVEMAQGKAVHHVNHLHDKPIEHTVTLTLGEGMKLAMKKAEERLGKRSKP